MRNPPPGEWLEVLPEEICVYDQLGEMGEVWALIPVFHRMEYEVLLYPRLQLSLPDDAVPSPPFRHLLPARESLRVFRPRDVPGERRLATDR